MRQMPNSRNFPARWRGTPQSRTRSDGRTPSPRLVMIVLVGRIAGAFREQANRFLHIFFFLYEDCEMEPRADGVGLFERQRDGKSAYG